MVDKPFVYTKDELIKKLLSISEKGWILGARSGNHGSIGNTLEDLLGIKENNLPIPNASEWELKTHARNSAALTTLFHSEPSPRAIKFVPQILLPKYGWKHKEAGKKYSEEEMSFRQTIHGLTRSDRGFKVVIDRKEKKVLISFDKAHIDDRHSSWRACVENHGCLREIDPQPYWGFDDLEHIAGAKLLNCFYIEADTKKEKGKVYFMYSKIMILRKFSFEGFLDTIEKGKVFVDFDARTGHNHGTKFRIRSNAFPSLYETVKVIK